MRRLLDAAYVIVLLVLSPWLLWRGWRTRRYRQGLRDRLRGLSRDVPAGAVWFHAVSLGEVHVLRQLVPAFRARFPDQAVVLSSTTDTGLAEARRLFADVDVFTFPFDFSWAVRRTFARVRPALVVLCESELWPNFLLEARRRHVPVAVVNGRMSPRSAGRYRLLGPLVRWLFRTPALWAMQTAEHAAGVLALGAMPGQVAVTGNIKYDGARGERDNDRTRELRGVMGIGEGELVWVVGSTQAPEEEMALGVYVRAKEQCPKLRLILVPRSPDRFDEVARLIESKGVPFARRSQRDAIHRHAPVPEPLEGAAPGREGEACTREGEAPAEPGRSSSGGGEGPGSVIARGSAGASPSRVHASPSRPGAAPPAVILVDTVGELSAVWGLADVAFVGGSLDGRRGGQNMIEPAAYGAAVTFGPHVWNFQDAARRLVEAGAAYEVSDAKELEAVTLRLLRDAEERRAAGSAARAFVRSQQGATERTVGLLEGVLIAGPARRAA